MPHLFGCSMMSMIWDNFHRKKNMLKDDLLGKADELGRADKPDWREEEAEMHKRFHSIFSDFLRGNLGAIQFCMALVFIVHLWDDLIDKDKDRTPHDINAAFTLMFGTIPTIPFYQQHIQQLSPLLLSTALLWQNANEIEHGDDDQQFMAFIVRQDFVKIFHYCMYLIGGHDYVIQRGPEFLTRIARNSTRRFAEFREEMQ